MYTELGDSVFTCSQSLFSVFFFFSGAGHKIIGNFLVPIVLLLRMSAKVRVMVGEMEVLGPNKVLAFEYEWSACLGLRVLNG